MESRPVAVDLPPTMRAVVFPRYGSPDVLAVRDVPRPIIDGDNALVRVHATSVNPVDWHRMRARPLFVRASEGLRAPKDPRLEADVAGTVVAVGPDATTVKVGDP